MTAALAVGAVLWGWTVAQHPALLPGELTVAEAAAGRPTLVALLVAMGLGTPVLVPSLALLFRLFLAGAALVVLVDSPYAIAAGVLLLLAFIAIGAAAIATPAYPGRDDDGDDDGP